MLDFTLRSKNEICRISEKPKPELMNQENSGFRTNTYERGRFCKDTTMNSCIVSESPNSCKENGDIMQKKSLHEKKSTHSLNSKGDFAKVPEIKKPEFDDSGSTYKNSTFVDLINSCALILSKMPNSCNKNGIDMSEKSSHGFLRIPISLLDSSEWNYLNLRQQKLFLIILQHIRFREGEYIYNGNKIKILPGQLCISHRNLMDLYNSKTKFKNEKIDQTFVRRAESAFHRLRLADSHTDSGISVITITYPEIYNYFKSIPDSRTDIGSTQTRLTDLKEDTILINQVIHTKDIYEPSYVDSGVEQKMDAMSDSQARPTKVKERIYFDWDKNTLQGIEQSDIEAWIKIFPHVDVINYLKFIESDIGLKPARYKRRKRIELTVRKYFENQNEYQNAKKINQKNTQQKPVTQHTNLPKNEPKQENRKRRFVAPE